MKYRKMRVVQTGETVMVPQPTPLENKLLWIKVFANAALNDPDVDQADYLARIANIASA